MFRHAHARCPDYSSMESITGHAGLSSLARIDRRLCRRGHDSKGHDSLGRRGKQNLAVKLPDHSVAPLNVRLPLLGGISKVPNVHQAAKPQLPVILALHLIAPQSGIRTSISIASQSEMHTSRFRSRENRDSKPPEVWSYVISMLSAVYRPCKSRLWCVA
jgi:hypothetical protein